MKFAVTTRELLERVNHFKDDQDQDEEIKISYTMDGESLYGECVFVDFCIEVLRILLLLPHGLFSQFSIS